LRPAFVNGRDNGTNSQSEALPGKHGSQFTSNKTGDPREGYAFDSRSSGNSDSRQWQACLCLPAEVGADSEPAVLHPRRSHGYRCDSGAVRVVTNASASFIGAGAYSTGGEHKTMIKRGRACAFESRAPQMKNTLCRN
jgi:hypothetical protein